MEDDMDEDDKEENEDNEEGSEEEYGEEEGENDYCSVTYDDNNDDTENNEKETDEDRDEAEIHKECQKEAESCTSTEPQDIADTVLESVMAMAGLRKVNETFQQLDAEIRARKAQKLKLQDNPWDAAVLGNPGTGMSS